MPTWVYSMCRGEFISLTGARNYNLGIKHEFGLCVRCPMGMREMQPIDDSFPFSVPSSLSKMNKYINRKEKNMKKTIKKIYFSLL